MDIQTYKLKTVWKGIKQRCLNENNPKYKSYGARGIKVCDRWLTFDNFIKDMGNNYKIGLTLDRINNEKGYFKENCRWVTMKIQNSNKRWNHWITYKNMTKTISQWANYLKINRTTLDARINKYGWSIPESLNYGRSS